MGRKSVVDKDIYFEMNFSPGDDEMYLEPTKPRHLTPPGWMTSSRRNSCRAVTQPCNISRSSTDTPASSVSTSLTSSPSSFIPRILRESFSKILHKNRCRERSSEKYCHCDQNYGSRHTLAESCETIGSRTVINLQQLGKNLNHLMLKCV